MFAIVWCTAETSYIWQGRRLTFRSNPLNNIIDVIIRKVCADLDIGLSQY